MSASFTVDLLSPPSTVKTVASPGLTEDQQAKLHNLEQHFGQQNFKLPISENAEQGRELTEREMMYMSRETFVRYLIATKWDLQATIIRLEACIVWRRTEDIENVERMAAECSPESQQGKYTLMGFSTKGQPIISIYPNRKNMPYEEKRTFEGFSGRANGMVYMLERARDLMPAGVTNALVIFNFTGKKQGPSTPISVITQANHILSSYYPETLGLNIFQNMPWLYKTLISIVWPFVDPNTKMKVKFASAEDQELVKDGDIDANQLVKEAGGDLEISYDHDTYWPSLVQTCLKLRADEEERWRALGERRVGREEKFFKRAVPLYKV
ncbi:uncharacterized protein IL334_001185 [Kwoniella shivajii]|uniref:CRAL-TRIO domain-containing protein n=1 Tax=Kwoniella shivajii TaxID=564305 RepID=A0ABZ1CR73_9TREE|nr:hypothetical protein IL334_001185 [Kwoniella shivajii]